MAVIKRSENITSEFMNTK